MSIESAEADAQRLQAAPPHPPPQPSTAAPAPKQKAAVPSIPSPSSPSLNPKSEHSPIITNSQPASAFFATLPPEVRRLIYASLFRSSNPLMKMHLHNSPNRPGEDRSRLMTTACCYVPTATYSTQDDKRDPDLIFPGMSRERRKARPRWVVHACELRKRWGVHWNCQAAVMAHWNWRPQEDWERSYDEERTVTHGGWMGCFLTCRKM